MNHIELSFPIKLFPSRIYRLSLLVGILYLTNDLITTESELNRDILKEKKNRMILIKLLKAQIPISKSLNDFNKVCKLLESPRLHA